MKGFWEQSWSTVDLNRVSAYIGNSGFPPDPVMEYLKSRQVKTVCDAGCGCGAYALRLAVNGFQVSEFDISSAAADMARKLLESKGIYSADFRAADVLATGYADGQFDAVVSRDVIDHMPLRDGIAAVRELCRITKDGGTVVLTLDRTDEEYEREPHTVNGDGDYLFSDGKWKGMVFHPYSEEQIPLLVQGGVVKRLEVDSEGFLLFLSKA